VEKARKIVLAFPASYAKLLQGLAKTTVLSQRIFNGWGERASVKRFRHVPIVLLSAALLGGCFSRFTGRAPKVAVRRCGRTLGDRCQQIDAAPIPRKHAWPCRSATTFSLTSRVADIRPRRPTSSRSRSTQPGGGGHRPSYGTADSRTYTLKTTYLDRNCDRQRSCPGNASTAVSYDTSAAALRQAERHARRRASRAKVLSDNVTTRLASYFISGS